MNKDKSKQWYYGCLCAYLLVTGYAIYDAYTKGYSQSLTMGFVSLALVLIAPLVFKLFKWKPIYEVYTLSLVFMFLSSTLGSAFRFYNNVPYWDKFVHGLSGILGILVGYFIYGLLKKCPKAIKEDVPLMLIFINAINISIAALWEVYEYAGLVLFDYDAILHYKTGVHDSMTDIIVCIIGGFIGTYFLYRYYKKEKPNFLTNIYEKFYLLNGKGKNHDH